MKKTYKYILFDWDGTLAKTLEVWLAAYKEVCDVHQIDLSKYNDRKIVEIFFGKQGEGYKNFGIKDVDKIYEEVKEIVNIKVENVTPYENAAELLKFLSESGHTMALHTTSNKNLLYPAIKRLDFEKYFKIILTKDDVINPKPNPEVIEKELLFLNAKKEECLIVGDSDKDMQTGKNSGIDTCLYYPKDNEIFYSESDIKSYGADFVITDLLELIKIVN